jgi:hypothetical protein
MIESNSREGYIVNNFGCSGGINATKLTAARRVEIVARQLPYTERRFDSRWLSSRINRINTRVKKPIKYYEQTTDESYIPFSCHSWHVDYASSQYRFTSVDLV